MKESKLFTRTPFIFIVDDLLENLQVLGNTLMDEGYEVSMASNGPEALEAIPAELPDLILLDVMMPGMTGFEVSRKLQENKNTKDLPVIFLTAKTETEDIVEGFKSGGVDYIMKPFRKDELLARIKSHLELKFARQELIRKTEALEKARDKMLRDLDHAAQHVLKILPKPISMENLNIDWKFIPSEHLAGDTFGYNFIDDDNIAMYLIDVSGHGIGPALHSVSIINTIRFGTLPDTDFSDPSRVLFALNNVFNMMNNNSLFFTIWYGVYNLKSRQLAYSTGGHPPAILFGPEGGRQRLSTGNALVGGVENYSFKTNYLEIKPGSGLYIFSDGAYEVSDSNDNMMSVGDLAEFLDSYRKKGNELDKLFDHLREVSGQSKLEDDFTIIKVKF